jgi:hypothetical protein
MVENNDNIQQRDEDNKKTCRDAMKENREDRTYTLGSLHGHGLGT